MKVWFVSVILLSAKCTGVQSLNVNFTHDLHRLELGNSDQGDGLSFEHFPVGLRFFDTQGVTGSVHAKSPHQTQAFLVKIKARTCGTFLSNYSGPTAFAIDVVDAFFQTLYVNISTGWAHS